MLCVSTCEQWRSDHMWGGRNFESVGMQCPQCFPLSAALQGLCIKHIRNTGNLDIVLGS